MNLETADLAVVQFQKVLRYIITFEWLCLEHITPLKFGFEYQQRVTYE